MNLAVPKSLLMKVGIVVLGIIAANEIMPFYAKAKNAIAKKIKPNTGAAQ